MKTQTPFAVKLGKNIARTRTKQRLTYRKLAELSEVCAAHIHAIEHGVSVPTLDKFLQIADALNVSPGSLIPS